MGKPNNRQAEQIEAAINMAPADNAAENVAENVENEAPAIEAPAIEAAPLRHPYDAIFESVHFSTVDSDRVFENDRTGAKQKKLANVVVCIAGGTLTIPGSIYQKQPKGKPSYVEFTFFGTMQQSAIKPADDNAKSMLTEWRRLVADDYAVWRKAQGTRAAVAGRPVAQAAIVIDGLGDL